MTIGFNKNQTSAVGRAGIHLLNCAMMALAVGLAPAVAVAEDDLASRFHSHIRPILEAACFDCHGAETQERGIRLDGLTGSALQTDRGDLWQEVLRVVRGQKMPPPDAEPLTPQQRTLIGDWISEWLPRAAAIQRQSRRTLRDRRLTVQEYNHTMQDLFGVTSQFAAVLPPDPISATGYQNDRDLLTMSTLQMEYYLEIARTAIERYVIFEPSESPALRYAIETEDVYYTTQDRVGTKERAPRPLLEDSPASRPTRQVPGPSQETVAQRFSTPLPAMPPGELPATEELRASQPKLHQQFVPLHQVPAVGDYVIRLRAAASTGRNGSVPRMRVEAGVAYGDGDGVDAWRAGEVDVTAPLDAPAVYEFRGRLEDIPKPKRIEDVETLFEMVQIFVSNVSRDRNAVFELGPGSLPNPKTPAVAKDSARLRAAEKQLAAVEKRIAELAADGVNLLYLDGIEVEFLPDVSSGQPWQVDMKLANSGAGGQRQAAKDLLQRLMPRAYRRPVSDGELQKKLDLFATLMAGNGSFTESLRQTLVSVLVSPHFLLLESKTPDTVRDSANSYALASRLSYLLWCTMPDERLLDLAKSGELTDAKIYAREAARLLDDPRAERFLAEFCRQWLRLDKFPLVAVNPEHYPRYDDDLANDTVRETIASFVESFQSQSSALELLDAKSAMLNDRLAEHYGLPPLVGGELRKVALADNSPRGGLLTQAALLTMNADGVDSHPIRRGVWIVDRLLGDPPPPPPPSVPTIEEDDPNFQGLSLRQRIELHRSPGACRNCHQTFDPWGMSLENFDATGRWRETILVRRDGKPAAVPVDAETKMNDGDTIRSVAELKQYLVDRHGEQFTQALTLHMLNYALGRQLDFADRMDAQPIHQRFQASGFQLRELILAIVESDLFKR